MDPHGHKDAFDHISWFDNSISGSAIDGPIACIHEE